VKLTDLAVVEIFGFANFDFVIIDMEHGPISMETAQRHIRVAEAIRITPIIRVRDNNSHSILRALDIGARGVQIPHTSAKKEAIKAVEAVKFSPQEDRGVCRFVRVANYSSLDRYEYFEFSNKENMTIIQVEGAEGIENLKDILTVSGINIVFLGPYD